MFIVVVVAGTGALGRGGAAIPRAAAMAAPLASILSTLAEDSVKVRGA
jgi:hypothetical protein